MESLTGNKKKLLFGALILMELVVIGLMLGAGQFFTYVWSTFFRLILLCAAYFCVNQNFAVFYSLFALFGALYLVDPVGLFITGRTSISIQTAKLDLSFRTCSVLQVYWF
jgi:hypothetical protein